MRSVAALFSCVVLVGGCRCERTSSSRETSEAPSASTVATSVADEPRETGDLPRIRERGELRVLVARPAELALSRRPSPETRERIWIEQFAARHGLRARFIEVAERDALLNLLREGRGDIVAAQLTVTKRRAEHVAFTRPTDTVDEHLVCRRGDDSAPRSLEELDGWQVHVRASSSYRETLEELKASKLPGLQIVDVPEHIDADTLAFDVGRGARPLTVLDSHLLEAIMAYNFDVEPCLRLAEGRLIAWAVRKESEALRAAADAFLIEKALTKHTEAHFVGDLDGIRQRGVLRVLSRNNPVTYFLYRGELLGFEHELAKSLAKHLGVRLEVVVPPSRELLIPWLLEGRADLISASMSITEERRRVVAFSRPYLYVRELLVQRRGLPKITQLSDLRGKAIHVRRSSSYFDTLQKLRERYGPFDIVPAAEELETEQLLGMVARGEIDYTVADSHILAAELTYGLEVETSLALPADASGDVSVADLAGDSAALASVRLDASTPHVKPIAFAMRPGNEQLRQAVDAFVERHYRGLEYNMALKRYFQNTRAIRRAKDERVGVSGRLSPYDEVIKKYSRRYGLDWRLMAAQAYQESRFDPNAVSWAGAVGLFQVMPATGRELGFARLNDSEESTHAGIKYMSRLIEQFESSLAFKDRVRFALASYNAGRGHVLDARRIAQLEGWNPDRWFHNVERAMLLLEQPAYYRRARYGYCRGSEPVRYVSEIQNRYDNYVKTIPE